MGKDYFVSRTFTKVNLGEKCQGVLKLQGVSFYLGEHVWGIKCLVAEYGDETYKFLEAGNGDYANRQAPPNVFLRDIAISLKKGKYTSLGLHESERNFLPSVYDTQMNQSEKDMILELERYNCRFMGFNGPQYKWSRRHDWGYFIHHPQKGVVVFKTLEKINEFLENL